MITQTALNKINRKGLVWHCLLVIESQFVNFFQECFLKVGLCEFIGKRVYQHIDDYGLLEDILAFHVFHALVMPILYGGLACS